MFYQCLIVFIAYTGQLLFVSISLQEYLFTLLSLPSPMKTLTLTAGISRVTSRWRQSSKRAIFDLALRVILLQFVCSVAVTHRMLHGRRITTLLLIVVLLNPSRIDSERSRGPRGKLFVQFASKPHTIVCKGIEGKNDDLFCFKWFLFDKIFNVGTNS